MAKDECMGFLSQINIHLWMLIARVNFYLFYFFAQVGAAHGPMLQDLREFLEENPDCAVAPEWAETVRCSVSTLY